MKRVVQPEILDSLPYDHPEAQLNRRDLRRIHALFRTFPWFLKTLNHQRAFMTMDSAILEMGAGEGDLIRFLEKSQIRVDGLDLVPSPKRLPMQSKWRQSNILTFSDWSQYPIVIANLILHQFHDQDLKQLGERLQGARLCIFNEPLRTRFHQVMYRGLSCLMGMNAVSRHDGEVSIQAGFINEELPERLGLKNSDWDWSIQSTITGFYRCVGVRK